MADGRCLQATVQSVLQVLQRCGRCRCGMPSWRRASGSQACRAQRRSGSGVSRSGFGRQAMR
ncbi:hypothetical protein E2562_039334 [Oryza meyeriana var. granulata]|uniref:Uncharacterized protein n=1 Tax=Oryza meyeriana var. granulata TaxID=110450 RepID=A0A6G1CZU3_9ORYZ|nr:hypothetical protein E2562_039334 [Oryza meyeriana var. granulata]